MNYQTISASNSNTVVEAWYQNGTIYYYTTATSIFMNENSS